jgi:HPt (histidine-containing phosphotransfer) domain-containing protein
LTKQDLDTFRRAAHSIKSSSKVVGALNLASQAAELEQMARDGNLEDAAAKTERLAASYDSVQQALKVVAHG